MKIQRTIRVYQDAKLQGMGKRKNKIIFRLKKKIIVGYNIGTNSSMSKGKIPSGGENFTEFVSFKVNFKSQCISKSRRQRHEKGNWHCLLV